MFCAFLNHAASFAFEHPEENVVFSAVATKSHCFMPQREKKVLSRYSNCFWSGNKYTLLAFFTLNFIQEGNCTALELFSSFLIYLFMFLWQF